MKDHILHALSWLPFFDYDDYQTNRAIEQTATANTARLKRENDAKARALATGVRSPHGPVEDAIFPVDAHHEADR